MNKYQFIWSNTIWNSVCCDIKIGLLLHLKDKWLSENGIKKNVRYKLDSIFHLILTLIIRGFYSNLIYRTSSVCIAEQYARFSCKTNLVAMEFLGSFSRQKKKKKKKKKRFYIYFTIPIKQDLTFYAYCLHWRQFAWNVKTCFMETIKKKINVSKCRLLEILSSMLASSLIWATSFNKNTIVLIL